MSPIVDQVIISDAAWAGCLAHALSTEREEIMGLLLGAFVPTSSVNAAQSDNGGGDDDDDDDEGVRPSQQTHITVQIFSFRTCIRSDRRKDRVEVSPELLWQAAVYAETLSKRHGRQIRVVGWYHSHPHITVLPSHVDLGTQLAQQFSDSRWVGLIFSVFSTASSSCGSHTAAGAAVAIETYLNLSWHSLDLMLRIGDTTNGGGGGSDNSSSKKKKKKSKKKLAKKQSVAFYHDVLMAVYTQLVPAKVSDVPRLLDSFRGREDDMVDKLRRKYNLSESQLVGLVDSYREQQRQQQPGHRAAAAGAVDTPYVGLQYEVKGFQLTWDAWERAELLQQRSGRGGTYAHRQELLGIPSIVATLSLIHI